ncbi:MAG TPA: ATP synthase F0 subunit B [Candidatus Hydrogenedentes bacterium]|nr:ATP synthase F0 subunit B [Candidatus Hydrogenedentota bacterium]
MITFNFTLVTEMVLFLVFLWVTNRFFFRPLRRIMDERDATLTGDKTAASTDLAEAEQLEAQYINRLTKADQEAALALRQARYEAYQKNRAELDALRHQTDKEVASFRDEIQRQLTEERQKFDTLVPGLVEAMDKQLRTGGTLR